MFSYDKGIKLNSSSLWLDAGSRVEACVVSHAHLDHAKKHSLMIATDKTIRILDKRIGKTRSIGLEFGEPYDFDGLNVTLLPAGHILGSAQILVQANGSRLLYSGDFNVQQSATAEAIEIPESDILIMESTFGQPAYSFPDRQQVSEMLCNFVAQAFRVGATPVVAGYALGKSQEAMKILGDAGYKLSVHGSVAVLARIYEEFGIRFGDWEKYKRKETDGKVLIIPRIAIRSRMVKRLLHKRIVFLSGWAVNASTKYRYGVDEAIPLSDHADFDGLLEYVRKVNPKKIYTTHGFREFPLHLQRLGFDAEPLQKSKQLSLF